MIVTLFAILDKKIDMTSQGTFTLYNGVDINQRREYIKIHATSYITRNLNGKGWDKPAPDEKGKQPIEPIHPGSFKILEQTKGPRSDDAKGQAVLRKKMGFGYRQCIEELIFAYVICRMDIGYAISNLAKHVDVPAECHYLAVKRIFRYLRQTLTWGLVYWRKKHRFDLDPGDSCIE